MINKDWLGNKKTTFVQLGASNHSDGERESNDYYATDPHSLEIFLDKLKEDGIELHKWIWECACGEGYLSEVLKKRGHEVYSSDKINRGYGEVEDYLQQTKYWHGDVLTNPPYKYAQEFVEKALETTGDNFYVIMYLKIQFLEGQARRKLFDKFPPKYVYVNSTRQTCYINGDMSKKMSSASCYCWFIWKTDDYENEPIIRWV